MCMEDVRIGRQTTFFAEFVQGGSSTVLLVPADSHRTSLIIGACTAGNHTVGPAVDVGVNRGITIQIATGPLVLDLQHHGALVTAAWYYYQGGSGSVYVCGSTLAKE